MVAVGWETRANGFGCMYVCVGVNRIKGLVSITSIGRRHRHAPRSIEIEVGVEEVEKKEKRKKKKEKKRKRM